MTDIKSAPSRDTLERREAIARAAYESALSENGRRVGLEWDATCKGKETWLRVADAILTLPDPRLTKLEADRAELVEVLKEARDFLPFGLPENESAELKGQLAAVWARVDATLTRIQGEGA